MSDQEQEAVLVAAAEACKLLAQYAQVVRDILQTSRPQKYVTAANCRRLSTLIQQTDRAILSILSEDQAKQLLLPE